MNKPATCTEAASPLQEVSMLQRWRTARLKRKFLARAMTGKLSQAEWRAAIEAGWLPPQRCPECDRILPIDREAVRRDHAECLAIYTARQMYGPHADLW